MLIINQHYMALQTPDGVTLPADLDEYGQYQPILELMRLISCDADMSGNIRFYVDRWGKRSGTLPEGSF